MVKICLTGGFAKLSVNKGSKLVMIAKWLIKNGKAKQEEECLKEIMEEATRQTVMEKLLAKLEQS